MSLSPALEPEGAELALGDSLPDPDPDELEEDEGDSDSLHDGLEDELGDSLPLPELLLWLELELALELLLSLGSGPGPGPGPGPPPPPPGPEGKPTMPAMPGTLAAMMVPCEVSMQRTVRVLISLIRRRLSLRRCIAASDKSSSLLMA